MMAPVFPNERDLLDAMPSSACSAASLLWIVNRAGMRDGDGRAFRLARVAMASLVGKGLVQRHVAVDGAGYRRTAAGDGAADAGPGERATA